MHIIFYMDLFLYHSICVRPFTAITWNYAKLLSFFCAIAPCFSTLNDTWIITTTTSILFTRFDNIQIIFDSFFFFISYLCIQKACIHVHQMWFHRDFFLYFLQNSSQKHKHIECWKQQQRQHTKKNTSNNTKMH